MTALTQAPPVQPAVQPTEPTQPVQIDAFSSAMTVAGSVLNGGPEAIGKTVLAGIENFNANDTQFRNTVAQAAAPDASETPTATATDATLTSSTDPGAGHGLNFQQVMKEGEKMQRESMGVMMQTYNFALEATLVSNAATTFTGSVNTLIKTQ